MRMRVSLCMITRDAALTLPTCLSSVADLVDEMIVVDTGSVDSTRALANQLGATVHRFSWVDDFAAARNESLRLATGEWILWLDADEYVNADNRALLRALFDCLRDENAAYLMRQRSALYSADGETVLFEQCRLFRNLPSIRWRYRVHEQIQPAVESSGGTVRPTVVYIEHSGYQDATAYRRKLERNLRLLLLEERERPDDPFTLMNLGWAHQERGHNVMALAYCQRGLARCDASQPIARKLHVLLVRAHLALGQRQQALATCQAGRTLWADDVELSFLEAVLLSELGNLPAAEALLLRLLEDRPVDEPAIGLNIGMRGHMARHNLARIYRAQGRNADAEAQWRAALAQQPHSVRSLFELGLLYVEQGRSTETEPIVVQLDALSPVGKLAATMLRAQAHLKRNEVAAATRLLEMAIAAGPPALEPRLMLSRLLVEAGTDDAATEQALRSVLALDPNHAEAQRLLNARPNKQAKRPARVSPRGGAHPYDRSFFADHHPGAYSSAKEVVPHVLELVRPESVIDVGCGVGSWLAVFREHGIRDVLGVDGAYVDLDLLQIPREQFLAHDLSQPLKLSRPFDLALALEVAEHLPADCAASLVSCLAELAPVVLFSAAVPFQGGRNHMNEQWPAYWVRLFEQHGYVVLDCLRHKVWDNGRVDWWYSQNLLLFCTPEMLERHASLRRERSTPASAPLNLVHPRLFLQAIGVILDLRRRLAGGEKDKE